MLYKGLMVTMLSGSLDGLTASHNRGGQYFRERVIPVDPDTEQQEFCRAAMADLATAWNNMTEDQREAWNSYAATITTTNRIGDRRTLTGRQAWSQFALPQFQQVEALDHGRIVTVTPPQFAADDFQQAPHLSLTSTTTLHIAWLEPTTWEASGDPNDGIIVHIGRPHPATKVWYQGPFQATHWIESDDVDPPTSPQDVTIPVGLQPTSGQALDVRIRLFRGDRPNGRVWQSRCICP